MQETYVERRPRGEELRGRLHLAHERPPLAPAPELTPPRIYDTIVPRIVTQRGAMRTGRLPEHVPPITAVTFEIMDKHPGG